MARMTQEQVEQEFRNILNEWMDDYDAEDADLIRVLSAAGLLATPTMIECAEACVAQLEPEKHYYDDWRDCAKQCWRAGRAHAATLPKRERYYAAGPFVYDRTITPNGCASSASGKYEAFFQSATREESERHAREHAARLNGGAK